MKLRYSLVIVCLTLAFMNLITGHWMVMLGNLSAIPVILLVAWVLGLFDKEPGKA